MPTSRRTCVRVLFLSLLAALVVCLANARAGVLENVLEPGDTIQGHAKAEHDCGNCHSNFDRSAQDQLCIACHKDIGRDLRESRRFHGRIPRDTCRSCHSDHKGRNADVLGLRAQTFDHSKTEFRLEGGHVKPACAACHLAKVKFRDAPSGCVGCHRKDDTHKEHFGPRCEACHTVADWKQITFEHDRDTHYVLRGRHATTRCEDCHRGALYQEKLPTDCLSCHRKDDTHKGSLGPDCARCHTERNWKDEKFDHDRTRFPLLGRHGETGCTACHRTSAFRDTPRDCLSCHRKDDVHRSAFGLRCDSCHTADSWKRITFDHARDTRYPLLGRHETVRCTDCHGGNLYQDRLAEDCLSCHRKDDVHKGELGTRCESCHDTRDWKAHGFDHTRTRFPLLGKHRTTTCEGCHAGKVYTGAPLDCLSCHRKDDTHRGRYGVKCESCHAAEAWKEITFDHDRDTRYTLRGKHASTTCDSCHTGKLYTDTLKEDCLSCHRKDDRHAGQEGPRCERCHVERDWKTIVRFDHDLSRFPLLGRHAQTRCPACHESPRFKDARIDCVACHAAEDTRTHRRRLGSNCEACHNARDWKVWDFAHDARTRFRLEGGHAGLDCYACHRSPVKARAELPTACGSCHARDDIHEGKFGAACDQCHRVTRWQALRETAGRQGDTLLSLRGPVRSRPAAPSGSLAALPAAEALR